MMQKFSILFTGLLGVSCLIIFFILKAPTQPVMESTLHNFTVLQLDMKPLGALTPWQDGLVAGNARGELRFFSELHPDAKPQVFPISKYGISAPVFEYDGVFFVGDENGMFWAFDPNAGIKWSYKTGNQITGSAVFCDGMIVVGSHDQTLYAFDPETGELKYTVDCNGQINGSPIFLASQRAVVFGSCDGLLRKVDVQTGKVLAEIDFQSFIPDTPFLFDGVLYLLTTSHGELADDKTVTGKGELAAVDATTFELIFRTHTKDAYLTAPFATESFLFLTDLNGKVSIFSRKDGTQIMTLGTKEKLTPVRAGDDSRIFAVSRSGKILEYRNENDRWDCITLADLHTDCQQGCLLLGNKLIVTDDNGGLFYCEIKP